MFKTIRRMHQPVTLRFVCRVRRWRESVWNAVNRPCSDAPLQPVFDVVCPSDVSSDIETMSTSVPSRCCSNAEDVSHDSDENPSLGRGKRCSAPVPNTQAN